VKKTSILVGLVGLVITGTWVIGLTHTRANGAQLGGSLPAIREEKGNSTNAPSEAASFNEGVLWVEGGASAPYKLWFRSARLQKPQLIANDAGAWHLTLSPDMKKLAYQGFGTSAPSFFGASPYRIVDTRGKILATSKSESVEFCGFSPDSQFCAFGKTETAATSSNGQQYALYITDLNTSEEKLIAHGVNSTKWTPKSAGVLFQTPNPNRTIWFCKTPKSDPEKLATSVVADSLSPSNSLLYLVLSPDNSRLPADRCMINLDTGKRCGLPSSATAVGSRRSGGGKQESNVSVWSANGKCFAFLSDGKPMVFDCDSCKVSACPLAKGEASELSFSPSGNFLAFLTSGKLYVWNRLTGKMSEPKVEGYSRLRGWIGEQLAVSASGKVYLVQPGHESGTVLHNQSTVSVWHGPTGEGCMLVQSNSQFGIQEIGLDGNSTESFPAMRTFSVDLRGAGAAKTLLLGLEGLSQSSSLYCGTEEQFLGYGRTVKYALNDLRFAAVKASQADLIAVSVKEKGKSATQYLLQRGKPTAQKIGEFAGAVPYWVDNQQQVLFFVYGEGAESPVTLQLYDIPSGTWEKLATSIAPVMRIMLTDAGRDLWQF
jgi:hypothetical protein